MATEQIPTAQNLMEDVELVFSPGMDLLDAIDKLARHKASAAPVVDESQHLLGMLTEKDCIRILSGSAFYRPRGGNVEDFMSVVRVAIEPEMDLFRVSELFLDNNFPMLPVVDEGKLVGCITRQDMLRGIMELTRAWRRVQSKLEEEAGEAVERPSSIQDLQEVFSRYSKGQLVRRLGRRS
ncbi:MAG: CBS domain-containing protein [Acidobacteria bacterium]|nr:MAG: CBS domain-containing protein [Acidobacteriota bacterium]